MTKNAPIAYFAYNRPDHTLRSLTSLAQNPESRDSELFIFCDDARTPEHRNAVDEVRHIVRSRQWCRSVHIKEYGENHGCAQSVMNGVTHVCSEFGRVIVVEDDLIVSPHFLHFMNAALAKYETEARVMQISGHMFPVALSAETDTVFLPFTSSWGWGTWLRAWERLDPTMSGHDTLKHDRKLRQRFDLDDSYPFFRMLEAQLHGRIDSWAIRWYLTAFMSDGLALYPAVSLVQNIGFDGSGTHCGKVSRSANPVFPDSQLSSYPAVIETNAETYSEVCDYLRTMNKKDLPALSYLKSCLSKAIDTCRKISSSSR